MECSFSASNDIFPYAPPEGLIGGKDSRLGQLSNNKCGHQADVVPTYHGALWQSDFKFDQKKLFQYCGHFVRKLLMGNHSISLRKKLGK